MEFSYVALDANGKRQKGKIESNSEKELIAYFRTNKWTPIKVNRKSDFSIGFGPRVGGINNGDIVIFTRQLSSMILTGITLLESLNILRKQTNKPQMVKIIDSLIANISEGKSMSQALSEHRKYFSEVYIALIRAAEAGGLMDKVLGRLADNLEKEEDLKKKIKSALFYPLIVIIAVIGVIVIMNVIVIPQLGTLYDQLNLDLPLPTKMVLGMSKIFTTYSPFAIVAVIAAGYGYIRFKKTDTGIRTIDKVKLHLPVVGSIFVLSVLDEVSRTLSILITSGTSIIEALNITANVAGNIWYKEAVNRAADLVEKGVPLSKALENQEIFPNTLIQLVKVGESTGRIDESLLKVADYFERDLDLKVKNLTTALEPIIIVVLGIIIGFIILAVITPIYGLVSSIS